MVSQAKVWEVQRLLAAGNGVRGTARMAGVARGTVARIARGLHTHQRRDPGRDGPVGERPPWRCSCGLLLVTRDCLRCRIERLTRPAGSIDGSAVTLYLGLELSGGRLERYRELRDRREGVTG